MRNDVIQPAMNDTIEAKVDLYYNIDKDPVIKVDVDTAEGNDFVFGIATLLRVVEHPVSDTAVDATWTSGTGDDGNLQHEACS